MNLKKMITVGITAAIAASTIAVTALTFVNGYDKPYKSGYSYAYTGDSYVRMEYYEVSNFVFTRAVNKKSTTIYPRLFVKVRNSNNKVIDSSSGDRTLTKKGSAGEYGVMGCSNYRSTNGDNYVHRVDVYTNPNHSNKVSTIKKTVG